MTEPRKPQDRKPKQQPKPVAPPAVDDEAAAPPDRIQTITWEGHDYLVDPVRLDDIVFMELLVELDTKPYYIAKVIAHMLGAEQWEKFKTNAADERGHVPTARVGEFFEVAQEQFHLGN